MIIVLAFIMAHFVDKSVYTIKEASENLSDTVAIFAILMRVYIFALAGHFFYKMVSVTRRELFL